jgi:hypothetical protein
MKIHGRCHCGRTSYAADVDPDAVSICHCTDCQAFSGSPWRASVMAEAAKLQFAGEPPKIYIKTAQSGRLRAQGFCEVCGSAIFSSSAEDRQIYFLRLGAIAERAALVPKKQIFCDSAVAWASNIEGIPR